MNRTSKFVPVVFVIAVLFVFMMISVFVAAPAKAVTVPEGYVGIVVKRGAAQSDVLESQLRLKQKQMKRLPIA